MAALHKNCVMFALADFLQKLLLLFGAVPDETEVAADDEHIFFLQLFHRRNLKPAHIPVDIPCYINQRAKPPKLPDENFALLFIVPKSAPFVQTRRNPAFIVSNNFYKSKLTKT